MKQSLFITTFFCFILFCGFTNTFSPLKKNELATIVRSEAGKKLVLTFQVSKNCKLFINHSYGKTVLTGKIIEDKIFFEIPQVYTKKSGDITWFLIYDGEIIKKGSTQIYPSTISKKPLEAYLGPPSTLVGPPHFVMFVAIPTDIYDNPMPTNTNVLFQNHFFDYTESTNVTTKNLIAWHNIFAPTKSGKIFISASALSMPTKEFEAIIYPNIPTNFSINYSRPHSFADGNQITNLFTSIIKDKYSNVVSDATQVNFTITNSKGSQLTTQGTTLNGIASAQILHPDYKETYSVKASVNGMADSNVIKIEYKDITKVQVPIAFKATRFLVVGPVKSYMNQLVPDGITVVVKVFKGKKMLTELKETTLKGIANFNFSEDEFAAGQYSFEISVLGKTIRKTERFYVNHKQQK